MRKRLTAGGLLAAVVAALAGLFLGVRRIVSGSHTVGGAVVHTPTDDTGIDPRTGSVRSIQGADIILPAGELTGLWNPEHMERLARTYWQSLSRFTLGLVHVEYTETERFVVLVFPWLRLLTFQAPEYEMDACRAIVRWRIERGLLVAPQSRGGDGYLEILVERHDYPDWEKVRVHVEVEVANFYPALSGISRWFYVNTQSRIHVIACHSFLRNLVKHDLDVSPVGRFAGPHSTDETPDPVPAREKQPEAGEPAASAR